MELLIVSDSHGSVGGMQEALARVRPEGIFHLGDGVRDLDSLSTEGISVYAVRGNCDLFEERPEEIVMALEGHVILAAHGHRYFVKHGIGALLSHAVAVGADVVLFGHTHQPVDQYLPAGTPTSDGALPHGIYLCNPGSIGRNGDGRGKSFGRLLLRRNSVLFSLGRV